MAKPIELEKLDRTGAAVSARSSPSVIPSRSNRLIAAGDRAAGGEEPRDEAAFEALRGRVRHELERLATAQPVPSGLGETTPRVTAAADCSRPSRALIDDCDGFVRRAAIIASLTAGRAAARSCAG